MIETDEQRRWWFATHPAFSWSHRGEKASRKLEKDDDKIDPAEVDAYVDKSLQSLDGPVADLLRSVKRHFGTQAYSQQGGQGLGASAGDGPGGWASLTGYSVDAGAFMPRLPTTQELSRWPKEMVRGFFRWLDTVLQNNPLLTDPNSLERHHRLVKELTEYFMDCGLAVDDFIRIMRAADHRFLPDGLHTGKGKGKGGRWNEEWRQFKQQYPAQNTDEHRERILTKLDEMEKRYGGDTKGFLLPPRRKRR